MLAFFIDRSQSPRQKPLHLGYNLLFTPTHRTYFSNLGLNKHPNMIQRSG
jgi:hypothetical protein